MNNFRTHKIIAFFLAVLMILPLIPAVDLTVFAVGENAVTEEQLKANINKTATLRNNYFAVVSDPEKNDQTVLQEGTDYDAGVMFTITDVRVIEGTPQLIYYEVALKSGVVHSNAMSTKQWIFHRSTNSSEDTASLIIGDTEPVTPSLTLDFLPAGLIAESETVSGTATINGTSVVVYKSLDNSAAGVAISVVSGTQVTLVTKYTFTTAEGAKLVFYRYDYNGDNTDLANAAISETGGYPFIYAGSLITTPVPTEKTDSATGVKINADLPEGVALTVTPKQLAEVGLNTNIYPVGASSLFYDVTLLLNNAEYQPTNGITVTFPESAILASGIAVGDSYHVYHIHEGAVEMRKAAVYNGGDLALTFTGLSAVGIAETEIKKNFVTDEGAIVSNSDYLDRVAATIKVDSAILYDYIEDGANGMTVSGILNYPIVLTQKIQYSTTGFVLYRFEYILDSTDTNYDENFYNIVNGAGAHYEYIPADYVTIGTIPSVILENNTKVKIKADQTAINLYSDPSTNVSDMVTVDAALLDGIYKISGTYTDVTTNALYYRLECCTHFSWPADYGMYTYVLSTVVEETDQGLAFPIVDFCNPAPIIRNNSQIQPRSAIYGARSAIAQASLASTGYMARSSSVYGVSSYAARSAVSNATNGLGLSKIATSLGNGKYQIELEAYTTGTVTVSQVTKPMDIVLVIDQSGSMSYCIEHGTSMTSGDHSSYVEVSASDVKNDGEYYIKNGSNYQRVYYCSQNSCKKWYTSSSHNGFMGNWGHSNSQGYVPSEVQFYLKTETASCTRRYDALVDALNEFVKSVQSKTQGENGKTIDHRIAIVGFSSDDYNNTELLTGVDLSTDSNTNLEDNATKYYPENKQYNGAQYGSITDEQYQAALQDVSSTDGYNNVLDAIDALTAHGGTQTLDGMNMAYEILNRNTKKDEDRDQVVILFTDGATNSDEGDLLNRSYDIKHDLGATVYGVGIFEGADGSPTIEPTSITNSNHLMHLISSNYPDAQYTASGWSGGTLYAGDPNPLLETGVSYYLSASNAEALKEIFHNISTTISEAASELNQEAEIRDIVTPQFVVPANASSVEVYQVPYKGTGDDWGTAVKLNASQMVTINTADNTLSITGFDFKHNFVSENGRDENDKNKSGDFYGRKIRIVFIVTENPDFLGGSNALTNGADSGVYDAGGTLAGRFPQPTVDVPLKAISTVAQDKNIYYGNTTDLTGILNLHVTASSSGKSLQELANGTNNAYVQLKYTITINNQDVVYYTIPAGARWNAGTWTRVVNGVTEEIEMDKVKIDNDTPYGIICDMTDAGGSLEPQQATGSAMIYVYKPTLIFKDSSQEYNQKLNMGTDETSFLKAHYVDTTWSRQETNNSITTTINSTSVNMEGSEPEFTFTFTHSGNFTNHTMQSTSDVNVTVTATLQGKHPDGNLADSISSNNNGDFTFTHSDCTHEEWPENVHFIVHVFNATTTLMISKETGKLVFNNESGEYVFEADDFSSVDPNQTFIFNISCSVKGFELNLDVTVHGNDSVIIDGLYIGKQYTITEKTDWSWRYSCYSWKHNNSDSEYGSDNTAEITLGSHGNVIFQNARHNIYWLDGDSWCDNRFMSIASPAIN